MKIHLLFLLWIWQLAAVAQSEYVEASERVAMRSLGHELLLAVGDSSSRVLPVTFSKNKYLIRFSEPLSIDPGVLSSTVDQVFSNSDLKRDYIVEVLDCASREIHYSYERSASNQQLLVPCTGRLLPVGCYEIAILLRSPTSIFAESSSPEKSHNSPNAMLKFTLLISSFFLFTISLVGYFTLVSKEKEQGNEAVIQLGDFRFFEKEGRLSGRGKEEELTGKEAELLLCLYAHKNATIDKAELLKNVWGDEGDYIGRTLDVYISRLRKKLEGAETVKIQNIRGVGYRLIV